MRHPVSRRAGREHLCVGVVVAVFVVVVCGVFVFSYLRCFKAELLVVWDIWL